MSDLAGVWYGTSSIVNSANSAMNYALTCRLKFDKRELVEGECTAVSSNPVIDGRVNKIDSSIIRLDKDCKLQADVVWSGGGQGWIGGYLALRNKEILATTKNTTGGVGVMNFVKE